jgi:serine/threonine protein kinase
MKKLGKTLQNGKYFLERELGEGGFGLTYKATNKITNDTVVIKTLNSSLREDPDLERLLDKFKDEGERLKRCSHPNIVRFDHFFIENGLPYIVMEYIPGKTLDKIVLPSNPLPESTAIYYIRQIGEALKVVHQNGLLHRDIKPENIILRSETEQVVLIDFGIAREFSPGTFQTLTHTRIISEGYAPIEQYILRAKRTPATDIYGLAATLYTLLTGSIPIASTLRDRFPLPSPKELRPELSEAVSEAVMRGMAVEQKERPTNIDKWLAFLPAAFEPDGTSQNGTIRVLPPTPTFAKTADRAVVSPNLSKWSIRGLIAIAAVIIGLGYAWSQVLPKFKSPTTQVDTTDSPQPVESDLSTPEAIQSPSSQPVIPVTPTDVNTPPVQPPQDTVTYPEQVPSQPPQDTVTYPEQVPSQPPQEPVTYPEQVPSQPPQDTVAYPEVNSKQAEKARKRWERAREKAEKHAEEGD